MKALFPKPSGYYNAPESLPVSSRSCEKPICHGNIFFFSSWQDRPHLLLFVMARQAASSSFRHSKNGHAFFSVIARRAKPDVAISCPVTPPLPVVSCHSRAGGNPLRPANAKGQSPKASFNLRKQAAWIPACAGMTEGHKRKSHNPTQAGARLLRRLWLLAMTGSLTLPWQDGPYLLFCHCEKPQALRKRVTRGDRGSGFC